MKPTRLISTIEPLESRIAPATLVNPTTIIYTDIDGDAVTVQITGGSLSAADFVFNTEFGSAGRQQLLLIDFARDTDKAETDLTITVTPGGGDGFAHVGHFDATGIDLGKVTVSGDLGRITAGDNLKSTAGINELTVGSIGVQPVNTTQQAGGSLLSEIRGIVNSLAVTGDINSAMIEVDGTLRKLEIGGDLLGGVDAKSGSVRVKGSILEAHIGGDIVGGDGTDSGRVVARKAIESLTLDGSLKGGNLVGSLQSGQIAANERIGVLTIGGSVEGGAGDKSAQIVARDGVTEVTIAGFLKGGSGVESGVIGSLGTLPSVTIKAGLIGGNGDSSGSIFADARIESVVIGDAAAPTGITGGSGDRSGIIATTKGIRNVLVHGSVVGGVGDTSGAIGSTKALGSVRISGDLRGGTGPRSGQLVSSTSLGDTVVDGNVFGGQGNESGAIGSIGPIESVHIGGDLLGDLGFNSGWIVSGAKIGTIEILGSAGTSGFGSGILESKGSITSISIGGDIGNVEDGNPISIYAGRIGSLDVVGSIISGFELQAAIHVRKSIGSINVGENVIGSDRSFGHLSIRAGTEIDSISIGGFIAFAEIAIGPGFPGEVRDTPANPDARLGTMTVGGFWINTSVAVGTFAGADGAFGTADDKIAHGGDPAVFGTIEEIIIGGSLAARGKVFQEGGIIAEHIQKLTIDGSSVALDAGPLNDLVNLAPGGGSFFAREIPFEETA